MGSLLLGLVLGSSDIVGEGVGATPNTVVLLGAAVTGTVVVGTTVVMGVGMVVGVTVGPLLLLLGVCVGLTLGASDGL